MSKLDIEIAEEVMEWKRKKISYASGNKYWHWFDKDGNNMNPTRQPFTPSTNINDAWRVVNRMEELGYKPNIIMIGGSKTVATFSKKIDGFIDNKTPMAICKAARETIRL